MAIKTNTMATKSLDNNLEKANINNKEQLINKNTAFYPFLKSYKELMYSYLQFYPTNRQPICYE